MNSIRRKLFFSMGLLIIGLVSMVIFANVFLLESYYMDNQKSELVNAYEIINTINFDEDYTNDLKVLESSYRVDILINDKNNKYIYSSINMERPTDDSIVDEKEKINDEAEFRYLKDKNFNLGSLVLIGELDNEYSLELKVPLRVIEADIDQYNNFAIIIGLLSLAIVMIFAYILSNYFTRSIIKLNDTTQKLKSLDFNSRCDIKSKDEIGQLGMCINEMADTIEKNTHMLNEKNIQLQNEIEEKNKLDNKRKELLNNVSHELKTPISLMQGYAEGIKLNVTKSKEKSDFYCEVIIDEASKMNVLVEKLLNINQIEFGDIVIYEAEFDIKDFVNDIVKKYHKVFDENQINFTLNNIDSVVVKGDSIMLESVFTNLINNAINHVDNSKVVRIDIVKSDETVKINVFNTTNFLSDDELNDIWTSFYKIDKSRSRDSSGHGLGLTIVKALQDVHGQKCGVYNIDNGIVFWFDIKIK